MTPEEAAIQTTTECSAVNHDFFQLSGRLEPIVVCRKCGKALCLSIKSANAASV